MGILSLKIRIALLWVFLAIISVSSSVYELMQKDLMEKAFGTAFTGSAEINISPIFVLVPLVMAILSISIKGRGNRITNIVLGIIWVLNMISYWIMLIIAKSVSLITLNTAGVVAAILIFVYAIRWPRYE